MLEYPHRILFAPATGVDTSPDSKPVRPPTPLMYEDIISPPFKVKRAIGGCAEVASAVKSRARA